MELYSSKATGFYFKEYGEVPYLGDTQVLDGKYLVSSLCMTPEIQMSLFE